MVVYRPVRFVQRIRSIRASVVRQTTSYGNPRACEQDCIRWRRRRRGGGEELGECGDSTACRFSGGWNYPWCWERICVRYAHQWHCCALSAPFFALLVLDPARFRPKPSSSATQIPLEPLQYHSCRYQSQLKKKRPPHPKNQNLPVETIVDEVKPPSFSMNDWPRHGHIVIEAPTPSFFKPSA
jgi:hypothetical protein